MDNAEFIKGLLNGSGEMKLNATYIIARDRSSIESIRLFEMLTMEEEKLSAEGLKILNMLEDDLDFPIRKLYLELKWKVLALITIQDAFDGVIYPDMKGLEIGMKNYFYFESLFLIREYFYCGFNNYLSASQPLLRTIVEFSIKQIYYDWACSKEDSYRPLTEYLDKGVSPEPIQMISRFLPKDQKTKPLKKHVQLILKGLSNSSSHAYAPAHSVRGNGRMHHEYSMDSVIFWSTLNLTLDSILWMYYFHYPVLFNPKDVTKKFGFSPPMGLYITPEQHVPIRESLDKEDYEFFKKYSQDTDRIKSLNEYYSSQESLSNQQILDTWSDEEGTPPKNVEDGYAKTVIKLRAMQEVFANTTATDAAAKLRSKDDADALFEKVSSYKWWQINYGKLK